MPKDPLLAAVLSTIFPGGGQVYNGDFFKALVIFFTSPFIIPWFIGIIDGYCSAKTKNRRAGFSPYPA